MVFLFDRTSINNFPNYISHKLPVTIVKELADEKNDDFKVIFIVIRILSYSIKLNISKMN